MADRSPRHGALLALFMLAGCGAPDQPPPPPYLAFDGLPVSGAWANARDAGFTRCLEMRQTMHCRRTNLTIEGQGPFSGAVDLAGTDGSGGFNELSLWHETNQYALYKVRDALHRAGWQSCIIGEGRKGDQMIFTRPAATVRISMEISYWGKRRLRVIPESSSKKPSCRPAS